MKSRLLSNTANVVTQQERRKIIQNISLEIVEKMLGEIRSQLPSISMVNESEKDQAIHPLYKSLFQEAVKSVIHKMDAEDGYDSGQNFIGINGFEASRI